MREKMRKDEKTGGFFEKYFDFYVSWRKANNDF